MKDVAYIIVDRHGARRLTKRIPALARDEIAIKLRLAVPDTCFKSPVVTVDLEVPADMVLEPTVEVEAMEP